MNLTKVTLENFKCFQKKVEIDFGRLTLLTGANSSGKSSVIYSVLGVLQSGEFPFQFSTNGKYVNMGDFKEVVYNHNRKEKVKLSFSFKNGSVHTIETIWEEDLNNNLPQLLELKAYSDYFSVFVLKKGKKYSIDYTYNHLKDPQYEIISSEILKKLLNDINEVFENNKSNNKFSQFKEDSSKYNLSEYFDDINSSQDIKGLIVDDLPFVLKKINEKGIFKLAQIFDVVTKVFSEYDENINFISSFRLHPERTYLEQTKSKIKVNNFGDGYLDQILIWETKNKQKFNKLIKILKELKLLETIKSKRLEGGRYEISVQIKKGGIDSSLNDVGFGISQFLPIIVADLQLPKNSTLYIAQPEIHLHPSVQSLFGDYLTNHIKTTEKSYVIETHSEYLLNKIRLAIVKGEINPEDVKIMYIDNQVNDTFIHKISFTKNGQIINAPENFFKTYMMDVMDIALNAAQ